MARAPARPDPAKNTPEKPAGKPRKRKRKLILATATALVIGATAGGSWYFLADSQEARAAVERPPVFLPLEPFTVNLQPERGPAYLQVGLSVKLTGNSAVDPIKLYMPEIRSRVLLLLSTKRSSELLTVEGKQKLAAEVAAEIKRPLRDEAQSESVHSVVFTSFVIQ